MKTYTATLHIMFEGKVIAEYTDEVKARFEWIALIIFRRRNSAKLVKIENSIK